MCVTNLPQSNVSPDYRGKPSGAAFSLAHPSSSPFPFSSPLPPSAVPRSQRETWRLWGEEKRRKCKRERKNEEKERNVNEGKKRISLMERKARINNQVKEGYTWRRLHGADANESKNGHCNNTVKQQLLMNRPERRKPKMKSQRGLGYTGRGVGRGEGRHRRRGGQDCRRRRKEKGKWRMGKKIR